MSNLCIIPARGGSKRIPGKNIKDFLGKPVIAYSIDAALKSGLFDEVMVSTDDDAIASVAKLFAANVPFMRSAKASDDFATTTQVIEEVLNRYKELGKTYDNICCLYPCAPLINSKKIKEAYLLMTEKKMDSAFPVVAFSYPIQRALQIKNEKLGYAYPENAVQRSQDMEEMYHDAGQFYWMDAARFIQTRVILGDNCGAIEIPEMEAQDIDTETDWKLAEMKYKLMYQL